MAADDRSEVPSPGSWLLVSVPLLWGIWTTLAKAAVLFR